MPRFPSVDSKLPDLQSGMDDLSSAHLEMATFGFEIHVYKYFASRASRNAELKIQPGDKVQILSHKDKKYFGTCQVIRVVGKQLSAVINDREGHLVSRKPYKHLPTPLL